MALFIKEVIEGVGSGLAEVCMEDMLAGEWFAISRNSQVPRCQRIKSIAN